MKTTVASLFGLFALTVALPAQTKTPDPRDAARAALRDGVPQAAIAPLKESIRQEQGDRADLVRLLARLQLAAGRPDEALVTLDDSGQQGVAEWTVLRAAALAAQGGKPAAAALLVPLAAESSEAALLLARILAEEGETARARTILAQAPAEPDGDPQRARLLLELALTVEDYAQTAALLGEYSKSGILPQAELQTAEGRMLLAGGKGAEAASAFSAALGAKDLSPVVRDNARLGLARAAALSGDTAQARKILREALAAGMTVAALRPAMEEWITLTKASGADPSGDLRSWASKKEEPRGVEATLQLARLDLDTKGTETALASLQELLALPELDPTARKRATLMVAEAKITAGQPAEALDLLDPDDVEAPYEILMLRGRAHAAAGSQPNANRDFTAAARAAKTATEKSAAAVNAFITALAARDLPLAREAWKALRTAAPQDPRLLEWSFLLAAAEARGGSIDDLSALVRRSPSTDYAFQAKLALAEWRLARGESEAAKRILKTAQPEAVTPAQEAALQAAAIFAADNDGSKARGELVSACGDFLSKYPESPRATDVTFKLAELHSRGGDHAAAETVLSRLMEQLPPGEQSALAKFLAAQAASRSMSEAAAGRALVWLNELAQGQTAMRHRARFEQASLLLRQRKFADALVVQDSILASDPPPEVRHAARMERGDILFALGATDPAKLDEAVAAYAELASDAVVPADWRDQAACKQAAALARRGQTEKALAIYREILDRSTTEGSDQFWFIKAGLEAARLLEDQKDWGAAVAIYDRMASTSGAQREELEQRARKLRLEHFIWEN